MNRDGRNIVVEPDQRFKIWQPVHLSPSVPMRGGRSRSIAKARLRELGRVILTKPQRVATSLTGEHDVVYRNNRRTTAETFEQQQGGPNKITLWQLDQTALADWYEREANPDDYEPEVSTCEDCGEPVLFDVTASGTVTEWCLRCGWVDAGDVYDRELRPTAGAFGELRPLQRTRRFWSGVGAGKLSVRPVVYRRTPDRIFVASTLVPAALAPLFTARTPNYSYAGRKSKYADIISFAQRGDPFIVPVPNGESVAKYQNGVRLALIMNRATCMGRWSVGRVKEGLRVGLIGSWREVES